MIGYGDIGSTIKGIVNQINMMFSFLIDRLCDDTFISTLINGTNSNSMVSAIQSTALVLCTMFFLIDFFTKTLHLQWVTWENVLMLFLKLFVAKVCVENAVWITDCIYSGFVGIVDFISIRDKNSIIPTPDTDGTTWLTAYKYFVTSSDATRMMNNEAAGFLDFKPFLLNLQVQIQGMIMQIIMIIADVVVLGRMFELAVYTLVAPIPLSTLACEGLTDIGKSFLKSYAAVCIQAIVLVIMFMVYAKLPEFISLFETHTTGSIEGWLGLLTTLTLGLGVMQSGSWAKRICNAM